jgi:hypothetical protein
MLFSMFLNIMKTKGDILAITILTDKPVPKWIWLIRSNEGEVPRYTNQNSLVIENHGDLFN